jgi:HlyD family secretion protein
MTDRSVIDKGIIMRKRIAVIAVVVIVLALTGWLVRARYWQASSGEAVFYGNVDIRDVALGFRVPGRVAAMHVDEGDAVKAGQLLASLDLQPFANDLALQTANVAQQTANLASLEAGSRPAEIERAKADVAAREAARENARGVFERQQELSKKDFASKQAYDDAAAQLRSAEAQLKSNEEALRLIVEGPRKEEIAAARAAHEAAVAQKQIAETALSDAKLHAPADGIILTRATEPGAILGSGETVYTLSLQKPVWVRAYVGEPQLGLIHPGARVQVFTDTHPGGLYEGQVGFISPVAEFTPKSVETPELRADLVYRFRVVVTNADAALRQGMPVTIRLSGGGAPAVASGK